MTKAGRGRVGKSEKQAGVLAAVRIIHFKLNDTKNHKHFFRIKQFKKQKPVVYFL